MKRQIIDKMEAWDESADRKPLILMGARQVGKTWLMEEFARRRYVGNTVVVNFMKSERLRLRFETTDLDPKSIIEAISIETGQKIVPAQLLVAGQHQGGGGISSPDRDNDMPARGKGRNEPAREVAQVIH